jgi:hypothetical protein
MPPTKRRAKVKTVGSLEALYSVCEYIYISF